MSAAKRSGVSSMPASRWKRVPAAGMSPADSAVEPAGAASRSMTAGARADHQRLDRAVEGVGRRGDLCHQPPS
jgi:hypothetical protein